MPPLEHRKPGLVASILRDARLTSGMIVDGVHVHPAIVDLVWMMLGSQRVNLVSDAMASLGMSPGEYNLGGRKVIVNTNSTCLEDGHLAGSLLSLDQALRNLINFTGCDLREALTTVTQVPAQLLHLDKFIGRLAVGLKADFVVLSPDHQVHSVWISGRCVFPV
jgi:N-acetylglucosamine-6-phosphate deacetylase